MSDRSIKYVFPFEKAQWLRRNFPNAFLLLSLIAETARRDFKIPDGLQIGDAIIGDPSQAGLSRQQYRTALAKLVEFGFIEIIYNGKKFLKRDKSTIKSTIKGMIVNLRDSSIWDINPEISNQQNNQLATNDQPFCQNLMNDVSKINQHKIGEITSQIDPFSKTDQPTSNHKQDVVVVYSCYNKTTTNIEKTAREPSRMHTALSSDNSSYVVIFECLQNLPIPDLDKINITKKFAGKEDRVKLAVKAALKAPRDNLTGYIITVASKENVKISLSAEERIEENRAFCQTIVDAYYSPGWRFEMYSNAAVFIPIGSNAEAKEVKFSDYGFKDQIKSMFIKLGFREILLAKN